MDIARARLYQLALIEIVHDLAAGVPTPMGRVPTDRVEQRIAEWPDDVDVEALLNRLVEFGALERPTYEQVGLTASGIEWYEDLLEPAATDADRWLTAGELRRLEELVRALGELDGGALDRDDGAELLALRTTLESQERSPRPNRGVVAAALRRISVIIGGVALGAAGSGAWQAAASLIPHVLGK